MIEICEIFKTIQGESSFAGFPCSIVRLAGCNLSCVYCDTEYAKNEKHEISLENIIQETKKHNTELICITGGEPLLQKETPGLCAALLNLGKKVTLETNGSMDISSLPRGVIRIVDIKTPGSGMEKSFLFSNTDNLLPDDECKFVICSEGDFQWAAEFIRKYRLMNKCSLIFSPAAGFISPAELADMIMASGLNIRLGIQLHKVIWPGKKRGI